MKKLTILFILVFLAVGLFAEPKVPKNYNDEETFSYINNDFSACYEVEASKNYSNSAKYKYSLYMRKNFLFFNKSIRLNIYFENEKQLDEFIKTIHLSDIENEFNRIRKLMIMNDATPNPTTKDFDKRTFDFDNPPPSIFYQIDGTKLK